MLILCSSQDSAKLSRDRISSSCGELNSHFQQTNTVLEGTLTRVQKKLSLWMKETSSSLKASLKHTAALQSLVCCFILLFIGVFFVTIFFALF